VIWIRLGNCATSDLESALRRGHAAIANFMLDPSAAILEIR
jgi:predicted nuclease of predicted toxin-antitoxin system